MKSSCPVLALWSPVSLWLKPLTSSWDTTDRADQPQIAITIRKQLHIRRKDYFRME